MAKQVFSSHRRSVDIVVIDTDLKSVWLSRPNHPAEEDFWEPLIIEVEPDADMVATVYGELAKHEMWLRELEIVRSYTSIGHPKGGGELPTRSDTQLAYAQIW